ncbi:MAG: BppU family phage baseplate upper protein, partial [Acidimicrobiales bacterium]
MRQIIDKHYDNDEFKFEFAEGSNATLLVDVQSLGSADTDLSGYTAKLYYYDSVRDTSSYQITSDSLDAATGRFTFDIEPTDLAEYGAYLAELVIIDGSDNEFLQCFGNVIIKESILDAGTTAATTGPVLEYTVFSSFSGTKTSGPYTAGTNITFSDPDSDGRVAINSSGGGDDIELDDLTDVTITSPTELQALIYDGTEWINGWPEVKMIQVRNDEGTTIPAGAPLYSKGEIGGSNRILVGIADANDSAKMPCIGIAYAEMNTSSTQDNYGVVGGVYNTELNGGFSGLNVGDTVYVKNWTGTPTSASDVLTTTRPTDGGVEVQNVGIILKTNGTIIQGLLVSAIGRSNDIPNAIVTTNSADADYVYIDDGNVWKKITPSNLGISGNSLPFGTWDYDSDLGTPDAGQFSTNNATASAVTQIKIHDNNSDGVDVSGITDLFNAGDYLYIQESGDSSTSHLYQIDSRGLSFTGGQSFNVTHQSL